MSKTELTLQLEREIWSATRKQGLFACFEVTIGWFGKERVDYLTYDTKGIWRCYEIKVSKLDFHSKNNNTFIGHFNYYVMTEELYEQVKDEIPKHIGVYINGVCKKKAKKQDLKIDEQILKNSLIRSLYRDAEKLIKSKTPSIIELKDRQINYLKKEAEKHKQKYWDLFRKVQEKYGSRWEKTQ